MAEFRRAKSNELDAAPDSDQQMMRQYGASALPTYVLSGKDGKVVQQYVGDDPGGPILERMDPDLKRSLEGNS